MEKTAIYLRSSKDRSDVSIDAQRRQLQDLASVKGFAITIEYTDAVESGKDDDRPAFQAMLRDIKSKSRGWGFILVLDTSRIARKRHLSSCLRWNVKRRVSKLSSSPCQNLTPSATCY